MANTAYAAEGDKPAAEATGDIVVTATRESTLLSKTPITLSAVSGADLRTAGVIDPRQLANSVPNFSLTESSDAVRISIRGVSSQDTSEKGDPAAAFMIDGIYIARPASMQGSLFDIDRVEVLRGPQGTLYGRNTTAGVVNVISTRPTDTLSGSLDASYGSLNTSNETAVVNIPVAAGLGVRAAVNFYNQDAYTTVPLGGAISNSPFNRKVSGRLSFGGRALDDKLSFVIRGDYSHTTGADVGGNYVTLDNFYTNYGTTGVNPTYVDKGQTAQRNLTLIPTYPSARDNNDYGVMGEFTYDFGYIQATYLGSYRQSDRNDVRNGTFFGVLNNPNTFTGTFKQNSHELRVAFGKGHALHGQLGGYLFHEKGNIEFDVGAPVSGFVQAGASNYAFPQKNVINDSKAVFGQLTYDVTPALHLTAGVRYTHDEKSRDGATIVDFAKPSDKPASFICAAPTVLANGSTRCTLNQNIAARTFDKTIWKIGADYDVPGLGLVYAAVSTGYKAGGFNDGCVTGSGIGCGLTAAALYYNPETLTNYEAGIKFRVAPGVRLNAAVFHYDYKNLQLSNTTLVAGAPQTIISNATSAKVDGIEADASLRPTSADKIDLGFTYTNARYSNFTPDPINNPKISFTGKALDYAPKTVFTAGYTHTFELADGGRIDAGVHTRFSAAYYMINLGSLYQFVQPSFSKTDLTLTYHAAGDKWFLQGYAQNLENKIVVTSASTGPSQGANIGEPRTFGVRAGMKF